MIRTGTLPRRHSLSAEQRNAWSATKRRRWLRKVLVAKHNGCCYLCGRIVELSDETSEWYATVDHVVPLSRGGRDVLANLALACRKCNENKGSEVCL